MLFLAGLAGIGLTELAIGTSVGRSVPPSAQFTHSAANGATTTAADQSPSAGRVCLGFADIFIAFILILLILATVFGNVLVVLSVFLYKRMRTFTNFLLTSLATADLLVGLLIMPLALFDLLYNHNWPLGRALCRIWATFDVLLCTASILNLCIISLDRYMAITSPLRYPRTRSRWMACALLSFVFVWGMAFVVCSPPWFVNEWRISFDTKVAFSSSFAMPSSVFLNLSSSPSLPRRIASPKSLDDDDKVPSSSAPLMLSSSAAVRWHGQTLAPAVTASISSRTALIGGTAGGGGVAEADGAYQCAYPMSVSYRIYSASVSFYIPLVVMLFVYFKIFRVASERERLIREGMGTCRLSRRVEKTQLKGRRKRSATTNYTHRRSNGPRIHEVIQSIASPTKMPMNAFGGGDKDKNAANHCSVPSYSKHPSRPNPTPGNEDSRASFGQISPTQRSSILREGDFDSEVTICPPSARTSGRSATAVPIGNGTKNAKVSSASSHRCTTSDSLRRKIKSMECLGTMDNFASSGPSNKYRKNSADPAGNDTDEDNEEEDNECQQRRGKAEDNSSANKFCQRSLQNLQNLHPPGPKQQQQQQIMRRASMNNNKNNDNNGTIGGGTTATTTTLKCHNSGGGNNNNNGTTTGAHHQARNSMAVMQQSNFMSKNANFRGSKEKIVYLRERKALKTIGIVVLGFIICWLPFFVVYVLEVSSVLKKWDVIEKKEFQLLSEFFLWLGYSNSVLNPLIYTMYNSDFRRCFRDLLGMGCMNQHRRTMSVKKLHQQSNLF